MIVQHPIGKEYFTDFGQGFPFAVNIGTPTTSLSFERLRQVVEDGPIPMLVSAAYFSTKAAYAKNGLNRDGYLFMFWFRCEKDAETFSGALFGYDGDRPYGAPIASHNGRPVPVIRDCPPGAPDSRFRAEQALYGNTEWFKKRWSMADH